MATREEKKIRLQLPSTSSVECEIRESLNRDEYVFTFFQNERQLKSCSVSESKLNQDQMVDLLSDAGVEFFSFSAIFDVADLLLQTVNDEFQQLFIEEEKPVVQPSARETQEIEETQGDAAAETVDESITEPAIELEKKISLELGDKLLKKFEMPYSQSGYAGVYYCRDGKYAIVLFRKETPLIRKKFSKDNVNEDNLVALISESGIDFLSFSAIYDTAELVQNIVLHPEEYLETEKGEETTTVDADEATSSEEAMASIPEVEEPDDEMAMVDLSALDVSEFKNAEDFDKFVATVTTVVNEGQPLPVKEVDIEKSGGVVCIILRQMDAWFLRFRKKDGSHSDVTEIKIDQDEIARLINQDIPQISFSYLYDASEKVFKTMEQLATRPMGDVILNVAVSHFLKIIEQYEADGDLKAAAQVTEVLLARFRKEKNTKGILQFGKKLLDYFEERKKITKAIKLRNALAEELLEIDADTAQEFVLDSLDTLVTKEKFLNAANLCGLLLDHYLTEEKNVDIIQNTMMLGRKQVDFYKRARLPSVMEENALRYAHYAIQQSDKIDEDQITTEQRESFHETIIYLLDQAFESQEERKANFELLESLENTLNLFRDVDDKITYIKYVDRLLISFETQDKKNKALNVAIDATNFLLDSENYIKACEYGNKSIKLFYELDKVTEAIEFSLDIVRSLVELKETNAARDYLKFVDSLVNKAYKADDKRHVEKQLIIGDLYGKLGLKDQAKSYIQAALKTIGDAKKREKIVLNYIDELLVNHAILSAQEMVNQELSRLLTGKDIKEVIKFCQNFIEKLREYKQEDMVFEYMKYCSSLMIQTDHTDYKVLMNFIKDLQSNKLDDKAAAIVNQLIILQKKQKDLTRAIDNIGRFIEYLLENTERFDLVEYYIQRITETYQEMGDTEGAVEALITIQKQVLEHSVDLAQRTTDMILKELEKKDDYKRSIDVVSPLIDKQMELGKYQDAYIFSVQNARYFERLGDIAIVINYLEKIRDKFIGYEQFEEANKMTDLILRFGRSHKTYKLAITAMKNYAKNALDRGDAETAAKFALEMTTLLEEENQGDKALEFLQKIFDTAFEEDKESSIRVFKRIVEIRADKDKFKKIAEKYLEPLIHKHTDVQLIEAVTQVLKLPFEDLFPFLERIFDDMLSFSEISDEMGEAIVNFVISAYDEGWIEEGDRIANKYATMLLNIEQITFASHLMATVLERTEKPISEVLPASFKFIKELINNSLLEGAREYTDRVIKMVTSEKKFGAKSQLLAAKISEKFAVYVSSENPDLASEYAYQASTFYRRLNDFDGVVTVYTNLAKQPLSPKRVIRTFKRGIKICKKFKADKYEAKLLSQLTEYLITSNNDAALASFQETLEKYEELQDLDELSNVLFNLIEVAIGTDNLKIAYTYLDYVTRLSTMINKKEDIGGIIVFLLRHAEEVKDNDRVTLVQKYINELGIKPKKYKKAYLILAKQRMAHLGVQFEKTEIIEPVPELEPEKELEAVPELVATEKIVPPTAEVTTEEMSQEMIDEKIDEEFVSVIKQYGEDVPEETQTETIQPLSESIIPISDEIPSVSAIEPSAEETPSEVESEVLQPEIEEIIEPLSHEEPEVSQKTALSDEEINTLFSISPSPSQEVPPRETDISVKSVPQPVEEFIPEKEVSEVKESALSENEMDSLFIPKVESPSAEVEQPEMALREEEIPEEDEWEVDSFGRLWKKEPLPSSTEELVEPGIKTEEPPSDLSVATPDITPLEKIIEIQEDEEVTEDISEGIFEAALEKPQDITARETRIESIDDVLKREEESETADIFDIPQVEYQEITPSEESKESQIETPDLADLFSDALSELGSISGKAGKADKDKKRKE